MVRTYCDEYFRHKMEVEDYNIMGQALRVLCQLEKTNFEDDESVKDLGFVARDAGELIKHFGEEILSKRLEEVS
jgi:hypothetical protein